MTTSRLAACLLAASLGGCVTPVPQPHLAAAIGEDAAGFSAAYARAANNQVLLNILQARERLPRHYLTVSGIADAPTSTNSGTLSLTPLGIGNADGPFKGSGFSGTTSLVTKPSYGVTPLTPENLSKTFYNPLPVDRFEYYWRGDWPRDLLVFLFAKSVTHGQCSNLDTAEIFRRKSMAMFRPSPTHPNPAAGECNFVEIDRGPQVADTLAPLVAGTPVTYLSSAVEEGPQAQMFTANLLPQKIAPGREAALLRMSEKSCSTVATAAAEPQRIELMKIAAANKAYQYKEATPAGGVLGASLESCSGPTWAAFVFGDPEQPGDREDIYVVDLRSIDQIVYYVGKTTRTQSPPQVGAPEGGGQVSLFTLSMDDRPCGRDEDFAANITYRGRHYWAGAPVPWPEPTNSCARAKPELADRSGTVLTILTQLYAMAATSEALSPPTRFLID